jgi:protein O-mannosyl-transferase
VAPATANTHDRIGPAVLRTLLVVAVTLAFSNTLAVPFLLDDFTTIAGNPTIRHLSPISSVLFPPPEIYSAGRPVLNLSFALNYAIGGTAVGGYHVINLAIHLASVLVLFGLLRRVLTFPGSRVHLPQAGQFVAFLIAGLWAVHPLQVNSVTYVSQRAESLMGLFYLLTLYGFVRAVQTDSKLWQAGAILACVLGMATKEVMMTAPVLVFLFDATCVSGSFRVAWRERWRLHVGLAATWLVLGGLMISSNLSQRAVGSEHGMSWFEYARIECLAVAHYLRLAIWPAPLIFDHGPDLPRPAWLELMLPAALLVTVLAIAVRQLIRCRVSGFLGCAFFLLLAPTSSVVPVAGQPIAENRMYLPLALVMTSLVVGATSAGVRRVGLPLMAAAMGLGWLCHERNVDFRDEISIWHDTVEKQPTNGRAWVYFSQALAAAGRSSEAIDALQRALRHRHNSAELENNLAVALFHAGRVADSIAHFQTAIRLKPDYAEAYYNLGALLYETGNIRPALETFKTHLGLKPQSVETHNYAGLCELRLGDTASAIEHFRHAVEIDPQHRAARSNLEAALAQKR